jgi:predicted nucleic acid-binding protein
MSDSVFVDSDAYIGWIVATDDHHQRATEAFEGLKRANIQPLTSNLVIAETASLLSRRHSLSQAKAFLQISQTFEMVCVTDKLHHLAVNLFLQQERAKTSFVDIANVVTLRTLGIPWILSFDKTYSRDFGLTSYHSVIEI